MAMLRPRAARRAASKSTYGHYSGTLHVEQLVFASTPLTCQNLHLPLLRSHGAGYRNNAV